MKGAGGGEGEGCVLFLLLQVKGVMWRKREEREELVNY